MSTVEPKPEIELSSDVLSQPWRERFQKEQTAVVQNAVKSDAPLTLPAAESNAQFPVFQPEKLDILPIRPSAPRRNRRTGRR